MNATDVPEYLVYFPCDWKIWKDFVVDFPDLVALVEPYAV